MSANYSEFNSEEEFLDIFNISSEHEILLNNSHHAVNEFGFVNIFDESTSATLQFVLAGVLLTAVAFFGVLGNILSIFVLSQKKIHASLTVLLIALSLCDLFVCVLLIIVKGLPILLKYFQIGSSYLRLICVPKKIIYPILQSGTSVYISILFKKYECNFKNEHLFKYSSTWINLFHCGDHR